MKRLFIASAACLLVAATFSSCKKCQDCTTVTTQEVLGVNQSVTVSQEYCGREYDNAPTPGSVSTDTGVTQQTITITCTDK